MGPFSPAYLELIENGEIQSRVAAAYEHLSACDVCPRNCRVNRLTDAKSICQTGLNARVSSYGPHLGEEDPLRGWRGSGTIFFAGCNLRCQFCQNSEISQRGTAGREVEPEEIAAMMLELQASGCHNINLVSPTHVVPQILAAVANAGQAGLRLPLVYNTGGYDSQAMLALLNGVVDIYMPDMKYSSARIGQVYSKVRSYPQINQAAVREMHRQVGDLLIDEWGLAYRGLLVRHLVLPNDLAGSQEVFRFLAQEISPNTYINIMDQYRPAFNARQFEKLNRPIKPEEYQSAVQIAQAAGLNRLDSRRRL